MFRYKDASIEDKNATIKQRLEYIVVQLGRIDQDLDSIEARRIAYINENNLSGYEAQLASLFTVQTQSDEKNPGSKTAIASDRSTEDISREWYE